MPTTQTKDSELKSFQLYKGHAPLPVQIIAGLMWLGGLTSILYGLPLLFVFGLGIIPILIGGFTIKYARGLFKMNFNSYKMTLVLQGLTLIFAVGVYIFRSYYTHSLVFDQILLDQLIYVLIVSCTLYFYRKEFIR